MPKIENTLNPFELCDTEAMAQHISKALADAPPFGSPESLAELESFRKQGEQLAALIALPTDTRPN